MKITIRPLLVLMSMFCAGVVARGQGTAFTYQGRLSANGVPAAGAYDLQFTVFDAAAGGAAVAGPATVSGVAVANGLFTVPLDFGAGLFTGPPRWLQIGTRPSGGGSFELLNPRQPVTPAPYAIHAGSASNLADGGGVRSLNNLRDNVTLAAGANVTLASSGNTIMISAAGGGGASGGGGPWIASGADAYYNAGNVGIGTATPGARLYVVSATAAALDNTAAFYAPAIGPFASHVHYGARGDWFIRSASGAGNVVLQDTGGNVGIGTSVPSSKLTVHEPNSGYGIEHSNGTVSLGTFVNGEGGWFGTFSNHKLHFFVNNARSSAIIGLGRAAKAAFEVNPLPPDIIGQPPPFVVRPRVPSLTIDTAGNVGIGNPSPSAALDVAGDVKGTRLILRADPLARANAAVLCEDAGVSNFVPYNTANNRPLNIIVRDATVRQLSITGGADLAEPFAMSHEGVLPGSVVVIDEQNAGHLKLSADAYDRRVAGVVSGANGIEPGISLRQEGAMEGGENVALSGRVYARADASFGAIKPGDLLTTSETPGHAMRVDDHARAQGAILGKAMTRLDAGRGMVLVLVTLQ